MQALVQRFINDKANIPSPSVVLRFSDIEVIVLNLTVENMEIDREFYLYGKLEEYRGKMPNLFERRLHILLCAISASSVTAY